MDRRRMTAFSQPIEKSYENTLSARGLPSGSTCKSVGLRLRWFKSNPLHTRYLPFFQIVAGFSIPGVLIETAPSVPVFVPKFAIA